MKRLFVFSLLFLGLLMVCAGISCAHFGVLQPSYSTVSDAQHNELDLILAFAHPMEQQGMDLARPKSVFAVSGETREDLLPKLVPETILGHSAWKAKYTLQRPGVVYFAMEPEPYWEPAEDKYIIHYTKTCVAAFGVEEGWEKPVGLRTEILPLTRPFGLYAGTVFRGQVLLDGKPAPGAIVEIEYDNHEGRLEAPNDFFITQTVQADQNGIFVVSLPFSGWWGMAALSEPGITLSHDGVQKPVELGAVLWIEAAAPHFKPASKSGEMGKSKSK